MDKEGNIEEHSKEKLELYRDYLRAYLSIFLIIKEYQTINIYDVFAGSGFSKNNQKGSALIAAEVINSLISSDKNPYQKKIFLHLNELDQTRINELKENLKNYRSFVIIQNLEAEKFIEKLEPLKNCHNLFFVDPFGYTQVSLNNINKLFNFKNSEILFFLPTNNIHRSKNYDSPAATFLSQLGFKEEELKNSSHENLIKLIKNCFKKIASTEFVYSRRLQNREKPNIQHCIFFITKHILGAQTFLNAQDEVDEAIKKQEVFDLIEEDDPFSLKPFIQSKEKLDNIDLYVLAMHKGLSTKKARKQLIYFEEKGMITVSQLKGEKRKKGAFYMDHQYLKKSPIISIVWN